MKTTTTESTTLDNIIGFIWAIVIVFGCSYLVFWKEESPWWFLLALLLLNVSVYHKKVVQE